MIYYLSQQLSDWAAGTIWAERLSALRLFGYITVRSAGAAVTALGLSWWLGNRTIIWLKRLKFGQEYADKAESGGSLAVRLLSKKGTPTMGGILIVLALNLTTLGLSGCLGNRTIIWLKRLKFGQEYAEKAESGGSRPEFQPLQPDN